MSGYRDTRETALILGGAAPCLIVVYLAMCLYWGAILCPQGGTGMQRWKLIWASDPTRYWFWWPAHLAAAVGMASWFGLANHDRLGRYTELGMLAACGILVIAILLGIVNAVF